MKMIKPNTSEEEVKALRGMADVKAGRVSPASEVRDRLMLGIRYAAELRELNTREWTMDEIDAEIAASRIERKA